MGHENKLPRPMPALRPTDAIRFWAKVTISEGNGCWEWSAFRSDGYGKFSLSNRMYGAHRCAWLFCYGDPKHLYVLHHCDNPACVRPDHLFLGTDLDNARDRHAKGRTSPVWREAEIAGWLARTHCKEGHRLTPDNVYIRPSSSNSRVCRTCQRIWNQAQRLRRKTAIATAIREGKE